jgi:DNA recombination protein RmuC
MLQTILLILVIIVAVIILIVLLRQGNPANNDEVNTRIVSIREDLARVENALKQEFGTNRLEANAGAAQGRTELRLALDQMRQTLDTKMADMQLSNERRLDQMRITVDEKLQKTLETRLGESFKLVSDRLEAVHKGLGDMQQLATGVGDLKRVLTNVKMRGVLGEYQLENLLEQMLTPDQYAKNVKTKEGSNANVEFAIKMPGNNAADTGKPFWLPIDSKFPKEDFELLMAAYDNAVPELIEENRKNFVRGIRKCAADICGKYIDPPNTTDFAILFLPFESLYAEVLRTPGLFETIQRECKIIITGPTTLSALLSSLQMGFRTLAIEKRSSEVWQLLAAVKTEFGTFGGILDKTQKKLQEASNVIEDAGRRSRAIERKLKDVQELPADQQVTVGVPPVSVGVTPVSVGVTPTLTPPTST